MANNDDIQKRAYAIWEEEGRPEGLHQDHWNQAENELNASQTSDVKNELFDKEAEHTHPADEKKIVQMDKGLKQNKRNK